MKRIVEKLKIGKELIIMIIGLISIIITCYKMYDNFTNDLSLLQKTTLRSMIWSEGVPHHDKIEACDSYIKLGYNSETKTYCEIILKKEFNNGKN